MLIQPFFALADKMERSFKKMIKNYLPSIQITVPSSRIHYILEAQNITPATTNIFAALRINIRTLRDNCKVSP